MNERNDEQPWRVGSHYGIHVYRGDEPVATFHTATDAAAAVEAHNARLASEHRTGTDGWCLGCGRQVAPPVASSLDTTGCGHRAHEWWSSAANPDKKTFYGGNGLGAWEPCSAASSPDTETRDEAPAIQQPCNAVLASCAEQWPDAWPGDYNPSCCRFPKSCSAEVCELPQGHDGDHVDVSLPEHFANRTWPAAVPETRDKETRHG